MPVPGRSGEAAEPGVIAVLLIRLHPVFLADGIQVVNTGAVFLIRGGINADNGVEASAAGIDQRRHRQLQLPDEGVLLPKVHAVGLDEGVAEAGDVLVFDPLSVQGVEAYPGPRAGIVVPQHRTQIAAALFQLLHHLSGGAVVAPLGGKVLPVFLKGPCDVAHKVVWIE